MPVALEHLAHASSSAPLIDAAGLHSPITGIGPAPIRVCEEEPS
ncbi:hypothetical protein ACWDGI_30120 [Streptomyces sp. NPDC001220]